jgi:hypothetical protein
MVSQLFIWQRRREYKTSVYIWRRKMSKPEFAKFTPFDRLNDDELTEAMIMHIRMGYILKFPGKSGEADEIARDIVSRLSLDQLKQIHPHTFFTNKSGNEKPKNPYDLAVEILKE